METIERSGARRLPPGSHGIPADLVVRNQRERLISAMAEACAEKGYTGAAVTDVVKRAGVSSVTFYKLFKDKQDCMFAAYGELLARLLEAVDRSCELERGREAKVRAAVSTTLALFLADPATARLLTVEIMALGPPGVARYDAAIQEFATRLAAGREAAQGPDLPHVEWALVASMSMLVGKRVMAGEADRLGELEDELVAMALTAI